MKPGDTIEYTTRKHGRSREWQAEITGVYGVGEKVYIDMIGHPHMRMRTLMLDEITSVRVTTPIGRRKC